MFFSRDLTPTVVSVPPKILWIYNNLPWSQFMVAESFVILAITLIVVLASIIVHLMFDAFSPPCGTRPCEAALDDLNKHIRSAIHPCENFHSHVCDPGSPSSSSSLSWSSSTKSHPEEDFGTALLTRKWDSGGISRNTSAFDKLSTYYRACLGAFDKRSTLKQATETTMLALQVTWDTLKNYGRKNNLALLFLVNLALNHDHHIGLKIWHRDGYLHLDGGLSFRRHLRLSKHNFVELVNRVRAVNDLDVSTMDVEEFLSFDDNLTALKPKDTSSDVALMPSQLFNRIHPNDTLAWLKALDSIESSGMISKNRVIYTRDLNVLQVFTRSFFSTLRPIVRSLWLLFHALLFPLQVYSLRLNETNDHLTIARSFCYDACRLSMFGFAFEAFLINILMTAQDAEQISEMVDLVRSQVINRAREYLDGDGLQETLESIEDVDVVQFDPSSDYLRTLDVLYDTVEPTNNYYANRLLSTSPTTSRLARLHRPCPEVDFGGVSLSEQRLCIWPHGLNAPVFYSGAEKLVNYPTVGFLLARVFVSALIRVAIRQEPSLYSTRNFAEASACLHQQYELLSREHKKRASDEGSRLVLEFSGSLQIAYDAYEKSTRFRDDLDRQFFFKRFCSMLCFSENLLLSRGLLPSKEMCNIVVRNVLGFYRAFKCYPEDYMGEVEVCRIL